MRFVHFYSIQKMSHYQKSVFSGSIAIKSGFFGRRPRPALSHDDPLAVEDHRVYGPSLLMEKSI